MTIAPAKIQLQMILGKPFTRVLTAPYSVTWRGHTYTVPKNYMSDGSSIPRLLWFWLGAKFDYANAQSGILHDAAYDGKVFRDGERCWLTPMQSHAMWREIRTYLLCADAGKIRKTRYHLQGWMCWFALVSYYYIWGWRSYVPFKTWRKRNVQ
jgi:hypothetical protein